MVNCSCIYDQMRVSTLLHWCQQQSFHVVQWSNGADGQKAVDLTSLQSHEHSLSLTLNAQHQQWQCSRRFPCVIPHPMYRRQGPRNAGPGGSEPLCASWRCSLELNTTMQYFHALFTSTHAGLVQPWEASCSLGRLQCEAKLQACGPLSTGPMAALACRTSDDRRRIQLSHRSMALIQCRGAMGGISGSTWVALFLDNPDVARRSTFRICAGDTAGQDGTMLCITLHRPMQTVVIACYQLVTAVAICRLGDDVDAGRGHDT